MSGLAFGVRSLAPSPLLLPFYQGTSSTMFYSLEALILNVTSLPVQNVP